MKSIKIVGAGPAGLVAAINLASNGFKVTVFEERSEVGHRFHGDFQGLENWSSEEDVLSMLQKFGIDSSLQKKSIVHPFTSGILYDSDLDKTTINSVWPFFYLVQRGSEPGCLDRGLFELAQDANVEVKFNVKIDSLTQGGVVGIGPRAADAIVKGVIFKTKMADTAAAILNDELAPKGYAYLLIHNGQATLATCMFKNFEKEKECLTKTRETFQSLFPSLNIEGEKEFGGYGNFFFNGLSMKNDIYYVGESAGLQDCFLGFGLRYAMTSGYLAAKAIIENKNYSKLLRTYLLPLQKTSLVNRFLFERIGNKGYSTILNDLSDGDAITKIRKQYQPSFLKSFLYPLAGFKYKSRLIDKGCHTESCKCVWCRHGKTQHHIDN